MNVSIERINVTIKDYKNGSRIELCDCPKGATVDSCIATSESRINQNIKAPPRIENGKVVFQVNLKHCQYIKHLSVFVGFKKAA